jgi:myxalamid-type polyketide synthase MxaE and MxaD
MVSSTGAWLAQAGQANYAAANAGLDALAQARRARGQRALSIGWGVWRDTGLVNDDAGALNVAEMTRQGIAPFAPEHGRALFTWLCAQPMTHAASPAHVLVLPIDWALHARTRGAHRPGWLRARAGAALPTADIASAPARLAAATPAARRGLLDALVREAVGQVLKLAPSRIDARKTFGSMGVTSLLAMELRNRLEAALERPLSATLAWNHPTVDALVAFLAQDSVPPAPTAALVDVAAPAALLDVAAVAQLSDDEAASALRARRSGARR